LLRQHEGGEGFQCAITGGEYCRLGVFQNFGNIGGNQLISYCRLGYLRRAGSTNRCFRRQGLISTGCQRKSSDKDQNVATFHDASCTAWVISARVSAALSTSLPGSTRIQKTCVSNRTIMVDDDTAILSYSGSGISSGEIT